MARKHRRPRLDRRADQIIAGERFAVPDGGSRGAVNRTGSVVVTGASGFGTTVVADPRDRG